MVEVYLDTDCILALVKDKDWLKETVQKRLKNERKLCTSVLAVVESRLVLMREADLDDALKVEEKIEEMKIKLLPLNEKALRESKELMMEYDFIGTLDALHIATAKLHKETILSTDHLILSLPDLKVEDPRNHEKTTI